ncbi:hypothetical protein AAFF_G00394780 [Aldrovandia affinis]|uniref:Uncharacterized protein n=1 Tax=Aldrovandia affinis TaxID=143900 RepID=A0AAD7WLR4_9TELE|nr:hypothetical protein AAFF_G00394780 [Aldrovandia affinis]
MTGGAGLVDSLASLARLSCTWAFLVRQFEVQLHGIACAHLLLLGSRDRGLGPALRSCRGSGSLLSAPGCVCLGEASRSRQPQPAYK